MSARLAMEAVSITVVTVWELFSVPVYQATLLIATAFSAAVRFVLLFLMNKVPYIFTLKFNI